MGANEKLPFGVYGKLQRARIQLQSTSLRKSGNNKFAEYQYFELGDFLPAVNEIFYELGLCSIVSFGKEEATLRIVDMADGSEVVFASPMAEANLKGCHPIQNLGAVETYSRRYLYVTALEIVEHDALDSSEPVKADTKKTEAPKQSAKSVTADVWDSLEEDEKVFLTDIAMEVTNLLIEKSAKDAANHIATLNLTADEKVALWSRFDSKQRSALKAANKPTAEDLANTP